MAYEIKKGSLPDYGMPLRNEIGNKPEKQMMGFPGGPGGPGPGGPGPGPGGPGPGPGGPGPGGPGGPSKAPTDDPKFPRSFAAIPAYVIDDNKVEATALDFALKGEIGDESAEGIEFTTDAPLINGIIIKGSSKYRVSHAKFVMNGQGVNDFEGIGAAVMARGNSCVTVEDCDIETNGVIRPCVACADQAELHVERCRIVGNSGPFPDYYDPSKPIMGPGMMEPPAGLFLGGSIRTTLAVGTTHSYYKDCHIESDSWAALSTDNGRDLYLQADNCDVIVRRVGYGVYADGGCNVVLNDCRFKTATHSGILAGDFTAKFNGCTIDSGKYDFMCHDLSGGADSAAPLEVRNSKCAAEEACVYIKSHNIHGDIENSVLSSPNYVIHAIVNDDPDARTMPDGTVPYGNKFYVVGSTLKGKIVNDDVRAMAIILDDSKVEGAIRGAYLSLTNGAAWYADEDSSVGLVDCLSISGIDAPVGVTITAAAASGTTLSGTYQLPSGGTLVIA